MAGELLSKETEPRAGDEIVARAERPMVLRVDVDHVPVVVCNRFLPMFDVKEGLDLQRRAVRAGMRPAAEQVATLGTGGNVRDRIAAGRLRIEVGPQRPRLARREAAFDDE